jgi:hypothetical protein
MKKSTKVWLGIATIWPALYFFLFIAAIIGVFVLSAAADGPPESGGSGSILFPLGFVGLLAMHLFTILEMLAMKVFYIVRVFKTEQLDQNQRIMWTLLLVFATIFAEPVFWYLYIWREPAIANNPPQLLSPGQYAGWGQQATTPNPEAAYVPPMQPPDWR